LVDREQGHIEFLKVLYDFTKHLTLTRSHG
jgi:hypothetical protein